MFLLLSIIEKSPAKCRGQEIPVVPPQFIPLRGPYGILADPQAVPGPTRPVLLLFRQAAPKGIPSPDSHCLAPSGSSLAESLEMYWFSSTRYRYVLPSLPLHPIEVNKNKVRKYTNTSPVFCAFCHPDKNTCISVINIRSILHVAGGVL